MAVAPVFEGVEIARGSANGARAKLEVAMSATEGVPTRGAGANALYAAVALRFGSRLVTLGRAQRERMAAVIPSRPPAHVLAVWPSRLWGAHMSFCL